MTKRLSLAILALALAGCDAASMAAVGGAIGAGGGGGPTLTGSVKSMKGDNMRVGLIGKPGANAAEKEIASTEASNGTFAMVIPATPPIDTLIQPDEKKSIVFSLRAYDDRNGNRRYDGDEQLCECTSGQFIYFDSDGPEGTYKKGWNVVGNDGSYTQSFQTAFVL